MGRRKIIRTAQEEEEFQQCKRARLAENSRKYRQRKRQNDITINNIVESHAETISAASSDHNSDNVTGSHNPIVDPVNDQAESTSGANEREVQQRIRINSVCNDDTEEHYGGLMTGICIHCRAKHFEIEKVSNKSNSYNTCCGHGRIQLQPFKQLPEILNSLFQGTHLKSAEFFRHIRSYNGSFSFASLNVNMVNFEGRRPGPYCFKIHGQIYYKINTALYPKPDERPSYGQLFIVDPNEAIDAVHNRNTFLDRDLLGMIDQILRQHNVFAHSYQMMGEELEAQRLQAIAANVTLPPDELQLLFTVKPHMDRRRYNPQRCNEVAAVFSTTASGEIPQTFVTIRNRTTQALQCVNFLDPNVEPWIYPLFYPYGDRGWSSEMKQVDGVTRLTQDDYAKYHLAFRNADTNPLHLGRRLFQQWIVDFWVKIEQNRLNFIRENQTKIRSDSYSGLVDYLHRAVEESEARIGTMVILPSSFVNSPRNMMQHYQDAMAIVRVHGKPDLFITMTCNPKWREIQENLLPGQEASDRPDICARVFDMKKKYLVDLITKQNFFGPVRAFVYVIESQKRGLLHTHMLVTLDKKLTRTNDIDKYISAEIPDPDSHPRLHQIVVKHMIHGPCGDWCQVDGKCSKHFPKQFQDETTFDADTYPCYRRRNTGRIFERAPGHLIDNRWVVPYCPKLSLILNCHINVEIVNSISAPKYLFKYILKGNDKAAIEIINESGQRVGIINHDEIRNYVEGRYIGPHEAVWRILEKKMHEKSHSVMRLKVHLKNQQNVTFSENSNASTLMNNINRSTTLTAYFDLNNVDEDARQYTYAEIPSHYTFVNHKWKKRQRFFNVIGRMYSISPSQSELFHLRLLLLHKKGAKSFEDLRTINGQECNTFIHACEQFGLVETDDEWNNALREASVWMMPFSLRNLFARILIHCTPLHPDRLWNEFKLQLSEDFIRRLGLEIGQQKAYRKIIELLGTEGSDIRNYPTMVQPDELPDDIEEVITTSQYAENGTRQYNQLNEVQKNVVDNVLNAVNNPTSDLPRCFFLDGPGGSGKTFIYTTLSNLLRSRGKIVSSMAFTGIAAILLPEGKTVHKTFGLKVPVEADSTSSIKVQSQQGQYLKTVDLFVWDEAPMAPRYVLEVVNRTLQDIMNNKKPFGGKTIILGGDFRQLPPVKKHGTRCEIVNLSIKYSGLWPNFFTFSLTQNMRVLPNEIEFSEFLLNAGDGILNDSNDYLELPSHCLAAPDADIVNDTYGEVIRDKRYRHIINYVILSARNSDVDDINERVMDLLDESTEKIYTSVDSTENCDHGHLDEITRSVQPEYLNTLSPPCLPPHTLRLRQFAIIILIRNLSINEGLCNGTRLMVLEMGDRVLRCEILTGEKAGNIVFLNRITLYCEDEYPFVFKRRQFPIKVAFAMTINKAQGQTFDKIAIDLRREVFTHGQFYVALSRVRSWDAVRIYQGPHNVNGNKVKNPVYTEMFM